MEAITASDRAAGLRSIANDSAIWPEAREEMREAANMLEWFEKAMRDDWRLKAYYEASREVV